MTSWITLREISLYKSNKYPDLVLNQFFSKVVNIQIQSSSEKIASILQDLQSWHVRAHRSPLFRGGRSHFFRLRLRSWSKILESGSGNFSNLRTRLLFRLRLRSSIRNLHMFCLRNDHTDSCYCRNWNMTPVQCPVSSEISDLCEIPDLLFLSYFASQNKEIKSGNYFFDVCCVN